MRLTAAAARRYCVPRLVEWQELGALADNPELPEDARTRAAAACFGRVAAHAITSPTDRLRGVLLLCVRAAPRAGALI